MKKMFTNFRRLLVGHLEEFGRGAGHALRN